MADAAIPLLNMLILGSFMAGGVYQLRKLGDEVIAHRSNDEGF